MEKISNYYIIRIEKRIFKLCHRGKSIAYHRNNDILLLTSGWIGDVASLLAEEDVACVGGILLNADGTVQSCGDRVGQGSADHYVPDPIPTNVGDPMQRYVFDHETSSVTGASG